MRRRRHSRGSEINMTPLLDVLFSILFIVLLAGAQSARVNADAARAEADGLREEIAGLQDSLSALRSQLESTEAFREDARVLTLQNFADGSGHRLRVSLGTDPVELESILMGTSRLSSLSDRLVNIVEGIISDSGEVPVYISFQCDKSIIYRREYETVISVLEELQREHREVFLRVAEE